MTPINPIELEKSLRSVELELIEINEDEWSRRFVVDIKLLLSAAKERLQQLKEPWKEEDPRMLREQMRIHDVAYQSLHERLITAEKERDELEEKYGKISADNLENATEAYKYFHQLASIKGERDQLQSQLFAAEKARDDYATEIYRLAEELRIRRETRLASNKDSISPNQ